MFWPVAVLFNVLVQLHGGSSYVEHQLLDQPAFIGGSRVIRVVASEAVTLPCEVINADAYVLVWKRGVAVLAAGNVKVTPDPRVSLEDGYALKIKDVQTQDAGLYTCQIGTLVPMELSHTLEVLVPPSIHHVTSEGRVEVRWGDTVSLDCHSSGNPPPRVFWSRKNNMLPSGEQRREGSTLIIDHATRHEAGIYLCTANNGVGEDAVKSITLRVHYQPEVEVERGWVHTGEGFEAQLVCIVHADPAADVLWYRDTLRLDTTERRSMEVRGNRHTLVIRKVQASDFGNYSCVADNSLGKMKQYLTLTGEPGHVTFRSEPVSKYKDAYNFTWTVSSYTPIEEYKLFFRKTPDEVYNSGLTKPQDMWIREKMLAWRDIVLPAPPNELYNQEMSYLIRGLEPSSQYEVKVQARNRFGWNKPSEVFQFSTRAVEVELRDLSMSVVRGSAVDVRPSALISIVLSSLLRLS